MFGNYYSKHFHKQNTSKPMNEEKSTNRCKYLWEFSIWYK